MEQGQEALAKVLHNGAALQKFEAMLQAQGVSADIARSLCSSQCDYFLHLKPAEHKTELTAQSDGNAWFHSPTHNTSRPAAAGENCGV